MIYYNFFDQNVLSSIFRNKAFRDRFFGTLSHYGIAEQYLAPQLYVSPGAFLEYIGTIPPLPALPTLPPLTIANLDSVILFLVKHAYEHYIQLPILSRDALVAAARRERSFVIAESLADYDRLISTRAHDESLTPRMAQSLTADYVYKYAFPHEFRRRVFVALGQDLLRPGHLPLDVSKFRLVVSDWQTQWARLARESAGKLAEFNDSLSLKTKGDYLDVDLIHFASLGTNGLPFLCFTRDDPTIVCNRISLYRNFIRFMTKRFTKLDPERKHGWTDPQPGIVFFTDFEGNIVRKQDVHDIRPFGRDAQS